MDEWTEKIHSAFLQLERRPAVFDKEIRKHVGQWYLPETIPTPEIISRFKQNADFILEDQKVILPLHEPESANLTGEFLLYYPDYIVPSVVYYDFTKNDFATIAIEQFGDTYPAWRLRFWHPDYATQTRPEYLISDAEFETESRDGDVIQSEAPLTDDGEDLIEDLRAMITSQEIAARDDARTECERLPPDQFLRNRGGIGELTTAGIEANEYGQQVVSLRVPTEHVDGPLDLTSDYGIYPGSEVLIDSFDNLPGFPAEADVLNIEGRQIELSFYWDRSPTNPDLSVFELESENRFIMGEMLNPVPFKRKHEAVDLISEDTRKRGWLTGATTVGFDDGFDVSLSKSRLNKFQYQAAHSALSATDIFCIHGPPGTGKTRTLIEIIRAACKDGKRVLAVAHSNQAIDNLLVGNSTEDHVDRSAIHGLVTNTELTATRIGKNSSSKLVDEEYLGNDRYQSDVVCGTMSSSHYFEEEIFDLVVIDEATQASIPVSLIPIARAERAVLAGDHKQLPPYHSNEHSDAEEMSASLFEHFIERYGTDIVATLKTQYRMNKQIAAFPNDTFYDGELLHGQKNGRWELSPLPPFEAFHIVGEEQQAPSKSYYNDAEANVVATEVTKLLDVGVLPDEIGIITPYTGQIGKIRSALLSAIGEETSPVKIATIDSFQGSERDAIIVSFVRSNPEGFSGFLTFPNEGPRRLNVALTRARKRCVLVGNFDTLRTRAPTKQPEESSADVYQALYEHLTSRDLLQRVSTAE